MSATDRQVWAESNRRMWEDPSTVEFWRYWQYGWDHLVRDVTNLLITEAAIAPGMRVIDLGSGHGEPALSLAYAVGPAGLVTATDLSAAMLDLTAEQAAISGLSNLTFTVADLANLPHPDATFDAATSRFSLMYAPDVTAACREIGRVLKPAGRFACAVWGDARTVPWHAGAMQVLSTYLDLPPLDLSAPGPFRFSAPGALTAILTEAGFADVHEATDEVILEWPDGLASFVTFVEALHCGLISQVPASQHDRIHDELLAVFRCADGNDSLRLPANVIVASGHS